MDRAGHYRRAEQLAKQAADLIGKGDSEDARAASLIALAQVHATLATSADSATLAAVAAAVAATARDDGNSAAPKQPNPNAAARVSTSIAIRGAPELLPKPSGPGDKQP